MIKPRVNRSLPVAFHEMSADAFEEMTCALVRREPGVVTADLYRTKRRPQYGIDVIAECGNRDLEVASCKCYGSISKGKIPQWSDEFLNHWETHWKDKNVRRFVLAVAADVRHENRQKEIEEEKARFDALGIIYEVWGPRQIQERLRFQPGIVSQYVGVEHVPIICGDPTSLLSEATPHAVSPPPDSGEFQSLHAAISDEVGHRLDDLLEHFRQGRVADTSVALQAIRDGGAWQVLQDATKARVFRLQASILLRTGDDAAASKLADQADDLSPQQEPRLRALLTFRREGPVAALATLGEARTQDGVHLKAALLLESGDIEGARELLNAHPEVRADHAETQRLRAIAALMSDQRDDALSHAEAALQLQPAWPSVLWTAARARYACALSPSVTRDRLLAPNPVPLDFVREDDRSRALLQTAFGIFEKLASHAEATAEERRDAAVYGLACLCCLRDRADDAAARIERMLGEDPAWAAAASWALGRGIPIDMERLERALLQQLKDGRGDAQQVLLLALIADEEGRHADAIDILEQRADLFSTSDAARALHADWLGRLRRRVTAPVDPAYSESGSLIADDVDALLNAARASGDWHPLEAFLDRLLAESPSPAMAALPVAQALASHGRWKVIAGHADAFVAMATPEPIRVAAHALMNANGVDKALEILRVHRAAFPRGRLPPDLARLEAEALARTGDQAAAIKAATAVATADGAGPQDALTAAIANIRVGDIPAALPHVRAVEASGKLRPRDALFLAQAIHTTDQATAVRLWRMATAGGAEPDLAGAAIALAFRLKLEREATSLLGSLGELAAHPGSGVSAISIDRIASFYSDYLEASEQTRQRHLRADLPVHLAAERMGANLARLLDLSETGWSGRGSYPVMMLNGNWAVDRDVQWTPGAGSIHMDITAVLVANQLGLLDALGRLTGQVLVPPSLPAALLDIETNLRHHQPAVLDAQREVLRLVQSKGISLAGRAPDSTLQTGPHDGSPAAWMVDFTPPSADQPPADGDGAASDRTLNLRSVVEALLRTGQLDPDHHAAALVDLGAEGLAEPLGTPSLGDALVLSGDVAIELARARVLARAADAFRISVRAADLDGVASEVENAEKREAKALEVASLRSRIAVALGSGTFRTVPEGPSADDAEPSGYAERCLREIILAPSPPGGVTWIDDRVANGFAICGAHRIVGTPQMLELFAAVGLITTSERSDALLALRASNALFLPLRSEEVLHHLLSAPSVDGTVVETPSLATLRRYFAKALEFAEVLVISPAQERPAHGELPFLLSLRRVAEEALLRIWAADGLRDDDRAQRSAWVWASLRMDRFPDVGLPGTSAGSWGQFSALQFAGLLANGLNILLQVQGEPRIPRLKAYLRWLAENVLPDWLWQDEIQIKTLASILADILGGALERDVAVPAGATQKQRQGAQALVRKLVSEFPDAIRNALYADSDFRQMANIRLQKLIGLGGCRFVEDAFWKACTNAFRGRTARVPTADGAAVLTIHPVGSTGELQLSGALDGQIGDPIVRLAAKSRATRTKAAQEIVAACGLSRRDAEAAIAGLVGPSRPADRTNAALKLCAASPELRLAELTMRLSEQRGQVGPDQFDVGEPSVLLRFLGFDANASVPVGNQVAEAAAALLRDFGAVEAIRRLSSLPVPLPPDLVAAACALGSEEREPLLVELSSDAASPLRLIHGLRLRRAMAEVSADHVSAFEDAARALTARWEQHAALFVRLLRDTGDRLRASGRSSSGLRTDSVIAVSWAHSDRITRAFLRSGHQAAPVREWLAKHPIKGDLNRLVMLTPEFDRSAAAPTSMTADALLFHGLGYALGTEPPQGTVQLSEETIASLRDLLSVGTPPNRFPSPWLLVNRSNRSDRLGSWLSLRPAWLFPPPVDLSREGVTAAQETLVAELATTKAADPVLWALISELGLADIHSSLAEQALSATDFAVTIATDQTRGLMALRAAAHVAHATGSIVALERLEEQLVAAAADLASVYPGPVADDGPGHEAFANLVEAAGVLSRRTSPAEGWRRFGAIVLRVADAWPGSVSLLRSMLDSLVSETRPDETEGLSRAWLRLRALR